MQMEYILDKTIWEHESIEDILLIVAVDNQDTYQNLADHELHAFEQLRAAIEEEHQEQKADLQLVNMQRLGLTPVNDPVTTLVYHGHAKDVDMVLVDGEVVVMDAPVDPKSECWLLEFEHMQWRTLKTHSTAWLPRWRPRWRKLRRRGTRRFRAIRR